MSEKIHDNCREDRAKNMNQIRAVPFRLSILLKHEDLKKFVLPWDVFKQ
jgi:hypothetical protein